MGAFTKSGLRFECNQCSRCCRQEAGYVFLSTRDLERLAAFFGIGAATFAEERCRSVTTSAGTKLSLLEKANSDCAHWSDELKGCSVYEARPTQCRAYPFWPELLTPEAWARESQFCPGLGRGRLFDAKEIAEVLAIGSADPPMILSAK